MKKLVAGCVAIGFLAGCADNALTEYSFGDGLRLRVQQATGDDHSVVSVVATVREKCSVREGKIALAFAKGSPIGLTLKGGAPRRVSCAI